MTAEIDHDPWATLDELLGVETTEPVDENIGGVAFYGRCSTEDNQDPETSLGWQLGNAKKFVEPLGGQVVAEFFDVGQSRSMPWERRAEASRLLDALKRPDRGWDAVVVGEGTRCWYGNQFSLTAPKFDAHGVGLWVPELGGQFDPKNPSHKMLMSVLGGMSESERQHVQTRVRAAMDAQVLNEGRHQGGRPPYGYQVVDGGPHPNPRKSAEGYRLRVLALDDSSAEVVRRIFAEYLEGHSDRAIAHGLNKDRVPCPSARWPDQNRHRLADGWQGSAVRAILENPRYTGYAFFGRWTKHEMLLDPDDVAAGHVTRFRRSDPDRVVRSRQPAHPQIVDVETFTQAQLQRRSRGAGGMRAKAQMERQRVSGTRPYALRGLVRCAACGRKMQGAVIRKTELYYRCAARSLAPGSAALAGHPRTVNLREYEVVEALNAWIGQLFKSYNLEGTVRALVASQDAVDGRTAAVEAAKKRVAEAESRLKRLHAAIEAGAEPAALVEPINDTQATRTAAQAELDAMPNQHALTETDVHALIDSLGDVSTRLKDADPDHLAQLYSELGLELRYNPDERTVDVTATPRVVSERVRGGT